jgi:hypothetical protein
MEFAVAAFLVAHGAIHASFLTPRPPAKPGAPTWPFDLDHSWLLSRAGVQSRSLRRAGTALVAVTVVAFALAGLAVVGFLPSALLVPASVAAAIASLAVLITFYRAWLSLGVLIDAAILWLAWSSAPLSVP